MPEYHAIWHGDSVELSSKFKWVDCIITDPPFGVANKSNSAQTPEGKKYARTIANDETPEQAIKIFKEVMSALLPRTVDNCDMYVFTSYQVLQEWLAMTDDFLPKFGFQRKAVLLWRKDGPGMGDTNSPWGMGCEFILFFQKGRREKSAKRRNNVIDVSQLRAGELIHPHEKPTALLEILIKTSTLPGDFLVDPFGGSGSLVRAARNCGRNAVSIELDKMNFDLAERKLNESESGFDFGE